MLAGASSAGHYENGKTARDYSPKISDIINIYETINLLDHGANSTMQATHNSYRKDIVKLLLARTTDYKTVNENGSTEYDLESIKTIIETYNGDLSRARKVFTEACTNKSLYLGHLPRDITDTITPMIKPGLEESNSDNNTTHDNSVEN